jgi:hypothetical protein
MGRYAVVALTTLLLSWRPVGADTVPPWYRFVTHQYSFDNLADYPDHVFFLTPPQALSLRPFTNFPGDAYPARLRAGEVFSPTIPIRHCEWLLIAVPRSRVDDAGGPVDHTLLGAETPGTLHSARFPPPSFDSAFYFNPRERVLHHYRVEISEGKVTLSETGLETSYASTPLWLIGLLSAGAFTWLGIRWSRRRDRKADAAFRERFQGRSM